jgi:hypothetical protein
MIYECYDSKVEILNRKVAALLCEMSLFRNINDCLSLFDEV